MPEIVEVAAGAGNVRRTVAPATVSMTVLAQDPEVARDGRALTVTIPVPNGRLQTGPANHRFHVVDVGARGVGAQPPVPLHPPGEPWHYVDAWADSDGSLPIETVVTPRFQAQNVFAIAGHTLALFERNLGRRVPWRSGWPHLFLVPRGMLGSNAAYHPDKQAVIFGWLPGVGGLPSVYSSLSYDVVAHEVTHAILDGLRPRYVDPGLPDQLAFHEALADIVALLSVFELDGVVQRLLVRGNRKRITFASDAAAKTATGAVNRKRRTAGRAEQLKASALMGLAEQLGRARAVRDRRPDAGPEQMPLRRSVALEPDPHVLDQPEFREPHRRAEVLVAAIMQTLAGMWATRIDDFDPTGGLDAARVAEEGSRAARHLLGMVLRSIDYLPPVELEFADVVDAIVTADNRMTPDDDLDYRGTLVRAFAGFGIRPPAHPIIDEDGLAAPSPDEAEPAEPLENLDPDAPRERIHYEQVNLVALRSSPEEVFAFMWNNAGALGIDVRLSTRVDRVLGTTRLGSDGLIVNEILADYTQWIETTAGSLPEGMIAPEGMPPETRVSLWGGGVLVFDQFGRFRLHQRKPILDIARQQRRLQALWDRQTADSGGGFGSSDGNDPADRFALLHEGRSPESW